MSPEEEARLRAAMANAREEAEAPEGAIDLDDPGQITASPTVISNAPEPNDGYTPVWTPGLGAKAGAFLHSRLNPEGRELAREDLPEFGYRFNDENLAPIGKYAIPLMPGPTQAALAYAHSRHQDARRSQEQDQKAQELTEKEATLKKAMERAKQIAAAKAQQDKVEKDRDESAKDGRGGYRIERALYPSDLHRK